MLEHGEIDDRAAPSLLPLLQDAPGVATSRSGQTGQQGSVFIRGGESRYARVLVDGVHANQPGGAYDFGTALPLELERVEIVRGAASSLYGTDALAGVVSLQTRRASAGDAPSLRAEGEGGSFDWQRWLGATSGARGAFDWNLSPTRCWPRFSPGNKSEGKADSPSPSRGRPLRPASSSVLFPTSRRLWPAFFYGRPSTPRKRPILHKNHIEATTPGYSSQWGRRFYIEEQAMIILAPKQPQAST